MNLLRLAKQTARRIKIASIENYKNLLQVNEKAQAASIDPYDDAAPEEMNKIQQIAKTIAIMTDKAYRSGISGSEIKYFVDKAKNQISQVLINTKSSMVKKDLTELQNSLLKIQYTDISSQMAGSAANKNTSEPDNKFVEEEMDASKVGLTPEMEGVVDALVQNKYRDPYQDFNNRPAGPWWYSKE